MTKTDKPVESSIVSLEHFDLQEKNFIDLQNVLYSQATGVKRKYGDLARCREMVAPRDNEILEINAEVSLLIGSDVPQALAPLEIWRGEKGEPYATRTPLGWLINGPLGRTSSAPHLASFINADVQLNEQFKKFCNMEFNDSAFSNKTSMSQEDHRAQDIMNKSNKLEEGHYELALPWQQRPARAGKQQILSQTLFEIIKKKINEGPTNSRKVHRIHRRPPS